MKVNFHTLGCKLNFAETSALAREFLEHGFQRTDENHGADVCIINSCSVTEHADKKCRNIIRRMHTLNPGAIIAVTGCYAQLRPDDIAKIEGVDIVLSNNDKGKMFQSVMDVIEKGQKIVTHCTTGDLTSFFPAYSSAERTRSFLKVQDGCDYCCTYCTIHRARGGSRNISIEELVHQARQIASLGQKEIVITGVNTGDFGRTTNEKFIDLLMALNKVEGIERYRISSIEPNLLTDEIIEFCASSPKYQPHFHIPIQCASDKVLRLMGRRYTIEKYRERIERIRSLMPDAFIGIDVMTGFPGEGEKEFIDSYRFLEELEPAFLHIFPFSERPGTPAVTFKEKVPARISTERVIQLEQLCNKLHRRFYERFLNQTMDVLLESTLKDGMISGYTGNYIRVCVLEDTKAINTISKVKLEKILTDENIIVGKRI
ncbi:MAG: tRNA (N(6)-L-threonylcarbamoyladenosine(37)-C(2))-methylthiotransferase MtaB [Alistipes sp.]|nr:tRNA (N(6)-L-threonylcarbamoyladenosine(37)-C(2))-methylthiotransferase MtaB [Candidatus Alistipes equi]